VQASTPPDDELESVGAPTEYADAEEVPGWVATLAKVIYALPTLWAALTTLELILLAAVLICVVSLAVFLLVVF